MSFWERMGANRLVWALSLARRGDAIGNSILFMVIPLYVSALPHPLVFLREALLVTVLIAAYGFLTSKKRGHSSLTPLPVNRHSDRYRAEILRLFHAGEQDLVVVIQKGVRADY